MDIRALIETYKIKDQDDLDDDETEWIFEEQYSEFIDIYFNDTDDEDFGIDSYEEHCDEPKSIYYHFKDEFDNMKAYELLIYLRIATEFYLEESETYNDVSKSEDDHIAWGEITYAVMRCAVFPQYYQSFKFALCTKINEYIDPLINNSRLECVVCLDKKIIYTACSVCNSSLVCGSCYKKINNTCPICRCNNMIKAYHSCDYKNEIFERVLLELKTYHQNKFCDKLIGK